MKLKRIVSTLVLVLIVVTAIAQNNYKVISNSPLNVREKASLEADILGTLSSGSLIEVVSVKKDWAKVKYQEGHGFVQAQYIEQLPNEKTKNPLEYFVGTTRQSSSSDDSVVNAPASETPETSEMDFESQRIRWTYEMMYTAGNFEYVKESGSYGIGFTFLPWKIAPKLYAGLHFSPMNYNYGLSDFNYDEIRLGPAIGYYFTPKIFISVPLNVLCNVYFGDGDGGSVSWGMALAPSVYIGSSWGVFIGPQFSVGFSGGSEIACGFRAGLYF